MNSHRKTKTRPVWPTLWVKSACWKKCVWTGILKLAEPHSPRMIVMILYCVLLHSTVTKVIFIYHNTCNINVINHYYMSAFYSFSSQFPYIILPPDCNAVVTCEIKLFQPTSTTVWNNFISARGNLPEINSKLFWEAKCSSRTFCNMFNVSHWNNFRTLSVAKIILFQFQAWFHVK